MNQNRRLLTKKRPTNNISQKNSSKQVTPATLNATKTLIYFKSQDLKPTGGPAGYLYNLSAHIKNEPINFLNAPKTTIKKIKQKILQKIPKRIKEELKYYLHTLNIINSKVKISPYHIKDYNIVHFHSTLDMYLAKDSLKDYSGTILLTSHSPKAYHKELIEDVTLPEIYHKHKNTYDKLEIIDEYAFSHADYIIFPTPEAEEPYYHTWPKYKTIHEQNKHKYIYLPTGINPIDCSNFDAKETRAKYNIPQDAFVICYVGRHNEVKGYDQLKKIATTVLKNNSNIYFLIAGKEEPIKGIKHPHWIEVGWTNQPHKIIHCSDLFILPNKETYFDLILLEVMSIGKPILLTNTGGNKYFKKFESKGLFFYDYANNQEAIDQISKILKIKDLKQRGLENQKIFNQNFTAKIFADNYLKIINQISTNTKECHE